MCYRDICNLQVHSTEDLDFIKTKTKDIALFSFRTYNNVLQHLSKEEFDTIKNLSQNKQISNSIVIVDRDKYTERIENFLSDQNKFQKIAVKR